MIFFIFFVLAAFLLILVGLAVAMRNFDTNIKRLYDQASPIEGHYHPDQIANLPLPVQNYFGHVLIDNQKYISYARLRHHGRFKTTVGGKWAAIHGEEYFTISEPGFIWKGKLNYMTAIDSYVNGKGNLAVYLCRFIRVINGKGKRFSQGELLRWLGEAVWFPTALLPNNNLHWELIDQHHAKLIYQHNNLQVYYIVTFNDAHEIVQLETRRYMGNKGLETWIGKVSNYKLRNNMLIPQTIQGVWRLPGGDFTYAVFYLTDIEYDQPKLYA
jgi:hypothetical protein